MKILLTVISWIGGRNGGAEGKFPIKKTSVRVWPKWIDLDWGRFTSPLSLGSGFAGPLEKLQFHWEAILQFHREVTFILVMNNKMMLLRMRFVLLVKEKDWRLTVVLSPSLHFLLWANIFIVIVIVIYV